MPSLKNSKPAKGQKLHKFIAVGGKPSNFNKVNGADALRTRSKQKGK